MALEASRAMWVDKNEILNLEFWPKMMRLMFLFTMISQVFLNIDSIYRYEPFNNLLNALIYKAFDNVFEVGFITRIVENWYFVKLMISELPGLSCSQIGGRIGLSVRLLLDIDMK